MEARPDTQDRMWKAIDALAKLLGAGVITAAITYYGITTEQARQTSQESTRQVQTLIEITNKQKDLDLNLGMRFFETLMSHYFQKDEGANKPEALRDKLLLLRLMALNFQDVPLNFKPLFEQLDAQFAGNEAKQNEVRDLARDVARRQALRLTFRSGVDSGMRVVKAGETVLWPHLQFGIKVESVQSERIKVQPIIEERALAPFVVTHFDTPLIDNIKMGAKRLALLLLASDDLEAQVRLIAFDSDLATDRFDIRELSRELSQNVIK